MNELKTRLDKLQDLAFEAQGQIMAGYRYKDDGLITEAYNKVDKIREELDKINLKLLEEDLY